MSDVSSSSDKQLDSTTNKEDETVTTSSNTNNDDVESYNSDIEDSDEDADAEGVASSTSLSTDTDRPEQPALAPIAATGGVSSNILRPSLLHPPKITVTSSSEPSSSIAPSASVLRPSKFTVSNTKPPEEEKKKETVSQASFVPLDNQANKAKANGDSNGDGDTKKKEEEDTKKENSAGASGGFVFGQNLLDKAEVSDSVPLPEDRDQQQNISQASGSGSSPDDSESRKRKFTDSDEINVSTGEEDEVNVLQIPIRLFIFINSNWSERVSRGLLRLNDKDSENSRVIVRTQGSFRLALNTKIFKGMTLERPNEKSVKFTANDGDGEIKVFLVMGSFNDMEQLYNAMDARLRRFAKKLKAEV